MAHLGLVTIVVDDYDRAKRHYVQDLGFSLVDDIDQGEDRRWVVVCPAGVERDLSATHLLLARADSADQRARIGDQTGGRVGFFLHTDDFDMEHTVLSQRGVEFEEEPRDEPYGRVAVFRDLYGNRWDLIETIASQI
ncbi:VOC family protein [Ilumatobacter sp.]|uniref:VOC family protein n=1 Tax=Ilumatobacter sp. TaxID=1967498 RepID=UPI003B52E64B